MNAARTLCYEMFKVGLLRHRVIRHFAGTRRGFDKPGRERSDCALQDCRWMNYIQALRRTTGELA